MNDQGGSELSAIAGWTKSCYLAGRAVMDATLRPYDLGATQWYVLRQLAIHGPTAQRELVRLLDLERATLSGVVAALVRKGFVLQLVGGKDQRQRTLQLTDAGKALWDDLPDLRFIRDAAFGGIDPAELAIAVRVLQTATGRLHDLLGKGNTQ